MIQTNLLSVLLAGLPTETTKFANDQEGLTLETSTPCILWESTNASR